MNYLKPLVVLALLAIKQSAGLTLESLIHSEWEVFKADFNKSYANKIEEQFRMKIYFENRQRIARHNKHSSFLLAMNEFGDLLLSEFARVMNGLKPDLGNSTDRQRRGATFLVPEGFIAPAEVDWIKKGLVTPVKNQGHCGSCWSFASIGALEGQHKRKSGNLVSLSEQNLVDCSDGNFGCDGGVANEAFNYIKDNGGIDTEESYPYEGVDGKCRFKKQSVGATVKGFVDLPFYNETALKLGVASVGPISASINAGHDSFRFYSSGIYIEKHCSSSNLDSDHEVLVVGYGTENGKDYWMVKNSWGTKWGEKGYIRMARNLKNQCGIGTFTKYPLV